MAKEIDIIKLISEVRIYMI